MPLVRQQIWTTKRRLWGNLIPAALSVPFGVLGWLSYRPESGLSGASLWYLVAFPVAGWVCANLFGYFQNARMREELIRKIGPKNLPMPADRCFVGFARPSFRGILDAHEDVGFLEFGETELKFRGETHEVALCWNQIRTVAFRPNLHTLVLLGGWASVEGEVDGTPVRLLVEPREKPTMFGSFLMNRGLRRKIAKRAKQPSPGTQPGA